MFKPVSDFFSYWFGLLKYYLVYNRFVAEMMVRREFFVIDMRLKRKGYTNEEIMEITRRYIGMRNIRSRMESREATIELTRAIAEISDKTGIPQWQLRSKVKEDFDIDI